MTDTLDRQEIALADIPLARDLVPQDRRLLPCSLEDLNVGADVIQAAGGFVDQKLRADRGACVAVAYMSALHGTDLIGTASQAYSANGRLAFMAQYINALVQRHLAERPTYTYQGQGATRAVHIAAVPKNETKALPYSSPQVGQIKVRNSPLWITDPDQQLGYYGIRAWARRHMPDVLLGIYAVEELQSVQIRDVTPPRPADLDGELDDLPHVEATVEVEEAAFEPSGGFTTETAGQTDSARPQVDVADDPLEWAEGCRAEAAKITDRALLHVLWDENEANRRALFRLDKTAHDDLERTFIDRDKELKSSD